MKTAGNDDGAIGEAVSSVATPLDTAEHRV